MFEYIKGKLEFVGEDYVVIDNNDIGYKINTSNLTIADLNNQTEKVILYTNLIVREDDMSIYGFSMREELKMFQLLITVSGVGPKVALGILSSIQINELVETIVSEDIKGLTKAQGVGKKTAQRIILELKDKVSKNVAGLNIDHVSDINVLNEDENEAIEALVALGYGKSVAKTVVSTVKDSCKDTQDMIKKALRFLAN